MSGDFFNKRPISRNIFISDQMHVRPELQQIVSCLRSGIAAANYRCIGIPEKRGIAGRTIANPLAAKLCFARNMQHPRTLPGGDNQSPRLILSAIVALDHKANAIFAAADCLHPAGFISETLSIHVFFETIHQF